MRLLAVCVFFACAMTLCAPLLANGEEQPCRSVGATVVCQRAGFDVLVGKLLDARKAADKCVLEAQAAQSDLEVLKARLAFAGAERDAARARVAVLEAKPFPTQRMLSAVGLGIVSGLAGSFGAGASSEVATASLFSVAAVSAATAFVLVLSE
jgi:hypothetical protein